MSLSCVSHDLPLFKAIAALPPYFYWPVAVTPQFTAKVSVEPLAKDASVKPLGVSKFGNSAGAGHTPLPVGVQLATVQLKPALGASLSSVPSAAAGPEFVKVTV